MTEYRTIPTPWRSRWRQIRIRLLPILAFVLALVAVAFLWEQELTPSTMAGEVYAVESTVRAPSSGILESLFVEAYQEVEAGEILGLVRAVPTEQMTMALAVLHAEIKLTRMGSTDPVLDQQRNLLNWQSKQQDWLEARARLASLQIRLRRAEREYYRLRGLRKNQYISESEFDSVRTEYEALKVEEEEIMELVTTLEGFTRSSRLPADNTEEALAKTIEATLQWQESRLRQLEAELKPRELRAPITGTVMPLRSETNPQFRSRGEFVSAGDQLMRIHAHDPDYIIGYARLPLTRNPEAGARIEIIRRDGRRMSASAEIIKVGRHFEALGPAFQRPYTSQEERALPLIISLPSNLSLRPGEIVDLHLR